MSEIVFVHGIAKEQLTADTLEQEWRTQLAGAVRIAGDGALADRIRGGEVRCRMGFYGNYFLRPGGQGGAVAEGAMVDELTKEWLRNVAARSLDEYERDDARRAVGGYRLGAEGAQGTGAVLGWAIRTLSRVPWFVPPVYGAASFVVSALDQVTRYLEEPEIRVKARERVLEHLGPETRVVIAHSLGSVVAWEALHQRTERAELPLLVTIGSPLGLRGVVYPNLWPQPPVFPPKVKRWVNVADRNDYIAAEPDLGPLFPGGTIEGTWTPDNGADPHEARFYLGKEMIGRAVAEAFTYPRQL
jgi:hypothetical protein